MARDRAEELSSHRRGGEERKYIPSLYWPERSNRANRSVGRRDAYNDWQKNLPVPAGKKKKELLLYFNGGETGRAGRGGPERKFGPGDPYNYQEERASIGSIREKTVAEEGKRHIGVDCARCFDMNAQEKESQLRASEGVGISFLQASGRLTWWAVRFRSFTRGKTTSSAGKKRSFPQGEKRWESVVEGRS